ncbi:MAG: hypothetical protein AAGA56_22480 [Myxococcota bacterium]
MFREETDEPTIRERDEDAIRTPLRIRCPRCDWHHDGRAYWGCELCGAIFDTFVTRARCPRTVTCGNAWDFTWCPACDRRSPHEAWYATDER